MTEDVKVVEYFIDVTIDLRTGERTVVSRGISVAALEDFVGHAKSHTELERTDRAENGRK